MHKNTMAWRPYDNLIDGELDNRIPGKVTGWIRFFRNGKKPLKAILNLAGDFHGDIKGRCIRLSNPSPHDWSANLDDGTFMDGFSRVQQGEVGDMTAGIALGQWTDELAERLMAQHEAVWSKNGLTETECNDRRCELSDIFREHITKGDLHYAYVPYPYIEWYSDANGRVVLELEHSQLEIVGESSKNEGTASGLVLKEQDQINAFVSIFQGSGDQDA